MQRPNLPRLSKRVASAAESETLRLSAELARLRRAGKDVVNLLEGEADLSAAPLIKAATAKALRSDQTRYSNSKGLPELRAAIAHRLREENRIPAHEDGVLVVNGAKQAIYTALQTICDRGDEVLIPSPYWVTFPESVRLAGARPVFVETEEHQLDVERIADAITSKTRAIILNSPNNPTGAVYPREALRAVAELARKRNLFIVADEAYQHLVYDGHKHVSIASLSPDAARRTITVQTFSKSFSMTGFRIGYLAAEPEIIRAAGKLHSHLTGNVCTFVQHGAIAALKLGRDYFRERRRVFQRRRDLAYAAASKLFDCVEPMGGFFVFPNVERLMVRHFPRSAELAEYLLKEAGVAVVPGSACGLEGRLRISFSSSEANIREGFRRIEKALCR